MPNATDEPRRKLARSPATAGGVTAVLVGSGAWFGSVFLLMEDKVLAEIRPHHVIQVATHKSDLRCALPILQTK